MEKDTARSARTVLIDTNILVSGLVFAKGNEHRILKIAKDKQITLVLPEFVLEETRAVLCLRFAGREMLLDAFLKRVEYVVVSMEQIEHDIPRHRNAVRDTLDIAVLTAVIAAKPNFAVTGDKTLRADMKRFRGVINETMICSSSEFLK